MILHEMTPPNDNANIPTALEFYQVAADRGLLTDEDEQDTFSYLQKGDVGERTLLGYQKEYGLDDWLVVRNLWMDFDGVSEVDNVLLCRGRCVVFEVKHYTGAFTYKNGSSKINGHPISGNCVQQARRSYLKVRDMCQKVFPQMNVEGVLVFTNPDNHVEILSEVDEISVCPRSKLLPYLKDLAYRDNRLRRDQYDKQAVLNQFQKYLTGNSYMPKPMSAEDLAHSQRGIHCEKCKSYKVNVAKKYVSCKCGYVEPREQAVLRTIHEYSVLNYDKVLTTPKLLDFLDGQVSRKYLLKVLNQNFKKSGNNRLTHYEFK